ncbi:hypothetical protein ACFE04_030533 [Oxalis oulophora]
MTLNMDFELEDYFKNNNTYPIFRVNRFELNTLVSKCKCPVVVMLTYDHSDTEDMIFQEFVQAAEILRQDKIPVIFACVDVTRKENMYHAIYFQYGLVPKIHIVKDEGQQHQEYKGPHHARGFADCLKKLLVFPAPINSAHDAKNLILDKKDDDIVILGVFPQFSGQYYDKFMAAARILKWEYDLCVTLDAKYIPNGDSIGSGPLVRMFVPFDDGSGRHFHTKIFNVDALVKFVRDNSTPIVYDFNVHPRLFLQRKYFNDSESDKVILYVDSDDKNASTFKSKYRAVAERYKGQGLIFMIGDLAASEALCSYFRLRTDGGPAIVAKNKKGEIHGKLYLHHHQLEPWVDDYKNGRVAKFGISQPIPIENNGPVQVVVAETFDEIVMTSKKNVLLGLYRSEFQDWSKVNSILCKVAEELKDKKDVVAIMDESVNDIRSEYHDDLKAEVSTTLFLIPIEGQIIRFGRDMNKEDIIDFVNDYRYDPHKKQKLDMDCDDFLHDATPFEVEMEMDFNE